MFVSYDVGAFTGVLVAETGIDSMVATMSFHEDPTPSNCFTGVVGVAVPGTGRAVAFFARASANFFFFSSRAAKRCSLL